MQFIDVNKARRIKFGEAVLGKTADGDIHRIRATAKSEDAKGVYYNWEFAGFPGEDVGMPVIVAVCVIKRAAAAPDPANVDNMAFNG